MSRDQLSAQDLYVRRQKHTKILIRILQCTILLVFLVLWEVSASLGWIDSFIFSSPSRILSTCLSMLKNGDLIYHVGITLWETLLSFFLVTVISISAALLLWYFTFAADVAEGTGSNCSASEPRMECILGEP